MVNLYLITGFLGSGKTTFLNEAISLFKNKRVHLIINEFGKAGVDGELTKDLGTVYEINNGSIFCTCKLEDFVFSLQESINNNAEVIIVESSGLSDPSAIRNIISDFSDHIHYNGCICLIDAKNFLKVLHTTRIIKSQLGVGDIFIMNKIDLVTDKELEIIKVKLNELLLNPLIFETTHGKITTRIKMEINNLSPQNKEPTLKSKDITLQKYTLEIDNHFEKQELKNFISLFNDETYRVKGFVCVEGKTYLLNSVLSALELREFQTHHNINVLTILTSHHFQTLDKLTKACNLYKNKIISLTQIMDNKQKHIRFK